jgi:hypothetical protein
MRVALALFLGLLFAANAAHADGERRFPHSKITLAEWKTYLAEVKAKPGVREVAADTRPDTDAYFVKAERTEYFFTHGGPAHPAIVVARVYDRNGKTELQAFGYFAGSETAFAEWFKTFSNVGPEMQDLLSKP